MQVQSRNILIALIVALLLLGGAWFFGQKRTEANKERLLFLSEDTVTANERVAKLDSDGDGLPDWKEQLLGSDKLNPDTDGDGTSDGDEVAQNRDPLTPGPDDENFAGSTSVALEIDTSGLDPTDKLSRELFAGYVALKEQGNLDTRAEQIFLGSLAAEELSAPDAQVYTEGDLPGNRGSSEAEVKRYWEDMKPALLHMLNVPENELIVFARALENADATEMVSISKSIEVYDETIDKLLTIAPPQDATSLHLEIINALSFTVATLEMMPDSLVDPIQALNVVRSYNTAEDRLERVFDRMNTYLFAKGIASGS